MIALLCIAFANVTTIDDTSSEGDNEKSVIMSEKSTDTSSETKKSILGIAEDFVKDSTTEKDDFRERWRPKRSPTTREMKELEERAKVRMENFPFSSIKKTLFIFLQDNQLCVCNSLTTVCSFIIDVKQVVCLYLMSCILRALPFNVFSQGNIRQ